MSPPLTLGLTGRVVATLRRAPLVFNIQDVFPDVAIELGAITNGRVIEAARRLERVSYRAADAVTVLSEDLRANVAAKLPAPERAKVRVIPNFVDTDAIRPLDRMTSYRRQLGIGDETVVMYAGNVGLSQSLELVLSAAEKLTHREDVVFVVNGGGSARADLERQAAAMTNVRFADYQPKERLSEVLATGDVHVVPLKRGLARSSVPSKTYSILAAARPLVASVDLGTEVARVVEEARQRCRRRARGSGRLPGRRGHPRRRPGAPRHHGRRRSGLRGAMGLAGRRGGRVRGPVHGAARARVCADPPGSVTPPWERHHRTRRSRGRPGPEAAARFAASAAWCSRSRWCLSSSSASC